MILQVDKQPKLLKPLENHFTIVLVSPPLHNIPKYKMLSVENFDWPISTKKYNENGREIVDTICNIYTSNRNNTLSTKKVKIICINVTKDDLSMKQAQNILKYLKTSVEKSEKKSAIDVIILPKISINTSKDASDIMESLWYLRERTVLISSSSLHATLPSTEIIAVRGETIPKTQDSVQDFVVTCGNKETLPDTGKRAFRKSEKEESGKSDKREPGKSERADEERVQSLAPAVVCGIALNILDCLQRNGLKTSGNNFKRNIAV